MDMNKQNMTNSQRLGPFLIHQMNSCCAGECVHTHTHKIPQRTFLGGLHLYAYACMHRHCAAFLRYKKALSVFLDMRDSSAWLQPAWTIQ